MQDLTVAPQTKVVPEDLGRFAELRDVRLTADGALVAAVSSVPDLAANRYRNEVVVGSVADPSTMRLLALTTPGSAGAIAWSPVGTQLAVAVHTEAGAGIELHDVATGQVSTALAGWPDGIEEFSWSPDGSTLLFVVREPQDREFWETPEDRRPPLRLTSLRYYEDGIGWTVGKPRQAYLVPAAGGTPVKLSEGGFDDAEFAWHPDGASVYFVSQRHPASDRSPLNDVFQQWIDRSQPVRRLTNTEVGYGTPRPSADGSKLAVYTVDVLGYPAAGHLGILADGKVTDLAAELDRECSGPSTVWLDGNRIAAVVDAAGSIGVVEFDVDNPGSYRQLLGGERRITAFDAAVAATAGETVAFVLSGPTDPPRLMVRGADGVERELFAPNAELTAQRRLFPSLRHQVPVADGVSVDSWLTLPDAELWPGTRPLMVWLQGGGSQYGFQWSHELQALCAAGYAVLHLNPRGSAGYGTDWMRVVNGAKAERPGTGWGVDDIADVAAVVRATLAANPNLDADRVGVLGGSYGGLVVTHLLAQTDLFAAGWAERGPYNLFSDAGTKDEAPWFFGAYLGGSHLEDPESYWQASPLRLVEGITDPLIIVHSEEDRRCAIQQAEELFMALKLLDREVEFVRFPGECHGLTRSGKPIHRLQRLEIMLEWFGRWLKP